MQNYTQIIGMQVISIYECEIIGTVINMQIQNKEKIVNLIISSQDDEITYTLPTKNIFSVQSSVLIKNKQALSVCTEFSYPTLINLPLIGLSGKNYGKIKEIYLNENWKIEKIQAEQIFESKKILSYTYSLAIIKDIDKKVSLFNFKPNTTLPTNLTQTQNIVNTLSSIADTPPPQNNTIFTPKTITAKLPHNFQNPKR